MMKKASLSFLLLVLPVAIGQTSKDELIEHFRMGHSDIPATAHRKEAIAVMDRVDRAHYCKFCDKAGCQPCARPYEDAPQALGISGQTISAPHMHLFALEHVMDKLKGKTIKALDVGCGSGYLTAAFHEAAGVGSIIIGIDNNKDLVELSCANIREERPESLEPSSSKKHIAIRHANGFDGYLTEAPYDIIHVGASTPFGVLKVLEDQLKDDGVIVMPLERDNTTRMEIIRKHKDGEEYSVESRTHVRYVPLTDQLI